MNSTALYLLTSSSRVHNASTSFVAFFFLGGEPVARSQVVASQTQFSNGTSKRKVADIGWQWKVQSRRFSSGVESQITICQVIGRAGWPRAFLKIFCKSQ